jgi:hypothetical protein
VRLSFDFVSAEWVDCLYAGCSFGDRSVRIVVPVSGTVLCILLETTVKSYSSLCYFDLDSRFRCVTCDLSILYNRFSSFSYSVTQ